MGEKTKRFPISKQSRDTIFVSTDGYSVDVHVYDGSTTSSFYFSLNDEKKEEELRALRQMKKALDYAIEQVASGADEDDEYEDD